MALTPTQEAVAIAVGNAFVAAGFTSEALATAMLKRLKLEQDKRKLESQQSNLRATYAVDTTQFNDALVALQAQMAAKQVEIDKLPA
jgi:hypothetical protein